MTISGRGPASLLRLKLRTCINVCVYDITVVVVVVVVVVIIIIMYMYTDARISFTRAREGLLLTSFVGVPFRVSSVSLLPHISPGIYIYIYIYVISI